MLDSGDIPLDDVHADERVECVKAYVGELVEGLRPLAHDIIEYLHAHAEVGGEEIESSTYLAGLLVDAGFDVERGVAQLPTAFVASTTTAPGPRLAFLAEYDALPGMGHACGHNASAATSIVAALALATCQREGKVGGTTLVIGTPGEENLSCKLPMIKCGVFSGIDAAMMVHAFDRWTSSAITLALDSRHFTFTGRAAHAAGAPEMGINALDAVSLTFHGINCLRQHVVDGCRIHGIVTKGGELPNIVPALAEANFFIRARDRRYLDELTLRIESCAKGAALMTGARLAVSSNTEGTDNIRINRPFLNLYEANLLRMLDPKSYSPEDVLLGSTDAGNVSYVVPTIHPLAAFAPPGTGLHTPALAEAARSDDTLHAVGIAATALAQTAIDLSMRPDTLSEVRHAFLDAK